jgi:metal-responsive CopG/Arc/MetJ family transcriptional regulator
MNKRVNIMLPETTMKVLDRVASKGNRSQFISRAVLHYVHSLGKQNLRRQLKAGYEANAEESLKIALEWFPLEEEAWEKATAAPRSARKDKG